MKRRLGEEIQRARDEITGLSHRIHANPEPAWEERRASAWVAEAVARHGYDVEHPAGRLATAVRARLVGGRGEDGPRIGILAEYDALPGLGHACGHNTMAASGFGAAIALAAVAPELRGEIVFLGTPAEERGSGKQSMIDDGLFDGLDAALLFHPSDRDSIEMGLLASEDIDVTFSGRDAHAAAEPWLGLNALDALVLLFSSIGLWRQQLKPHARVHGIVLEGGTAANIIPSRAVGRFMIRSAEQAYFGELRTRFVQLVDAAALATGCTGEAIFSGASATMNHNATLGELFRANTIARGRTPETPDARDVGSSDMGSSDMGNVSWVVPAIHPSLAICDPGVPIHSAAFRDAAITPRADDTTLLAATLIAETAWDLFTDPPARRAVREEFERSVARGTAG